MRLKVSSEIVFVKIRTLRGKLPKMGGSPELVLKLLEKHVNFYEEASLFFRSHISHLYRDTFLDCDTFEKSRDTARLPFPSRYFKICESITLLLVGSSIYTTHLCGIRLPFVSYDTSAEVSESGGNFTPPLIREKLKGNN